jgi:hypothetical protein
MRLINDVGYRKALFAHRVEWILAGYKDGVLKELPKNVWSVIYFDNVSVILARRLSQNEELIEKYGYRYITPFNLENEIKNAGPEELADMEKELIRAIKSSRQSNQLKPYLKMLRQKREKTVNR